MAIMMEVWGEYAAFCRPEMKTERITYEVMTPSAARGIIEAVFWHPGLRWIIDEIYVCSPIKMTNIRRNEVKTKMNARAARAVMQGGDKALYINTSAEIQQRAALVLKDVHYVINAHFEMTENAAPTDNPGKFQDITKRRLRSGQCFHTPYLGVREFPARFRLHENNEEIRTAYKGEKDLGYMLHSLDYNGENGIQPSFFHAKMVDGVIDLRDCEVLR
jgi:CRISPR-associated protein Cas5d